jgi:uncharacterized protein (DUF1778 family)
MAAPADNHGRERRASPKARRDAVINVRLTTKMRDLIDTAAEATGKTRTDFILDSARQHATDVLLDQTLFSLDERQYSAFVRALDEPSEPAERLKQLFREKAPWET